MNSSKIRIFYSYSHSDEHLRNDLETHLSILKRQGLIEEWHDRKIVPGTEWETEIDTNIEKADIILLLISPDFIASEYCYGKELSRAISLHELGNTKVVPIIIRPVDWQDTSFGKLQALPKDGKPVTTWANPDEAWLDIEKGLKLTINQIASEKPAHKEAKDLLMIDGILLEEMKRLQSVMEKKEKLGGTPTGFIEVDQITDGLHKGDVFLVAGRPSMSITDFVLNIAINVSISGHLPILLFSMRLTPDHVARCWLVSESEIEMSRILKGNISAKDVARLPQVISSLSGEKIFIQSGQIVTDAEIQEAIEKIAASNELGLLIIDGSEFITTTQKYQTRAVEISSISKKLKLLAQTYKIPIILTVNTSREADLRQNKRPLIRDLNEWEPLATNTANVVLLLYRPEVYFDDREDIKGIAEIIVAKNDYGPITTAKLAYIDKIFAFRNLYYAE